MTILIFLAVLAVLVLSHEFGHFIAARRSGMKVEEFGFGFPPRLFGFRRIWKKDNPQIKKWQWVWGPKAIDSIAAPEGFTSSTLYSFNLLPLGGFVKIKGEDAASPNAAAGDSFAGKPAWQKIIVIVAGVFMNIVVAFVLLSLALGIGSLRPIDQLTDTRYIRDRRVEIQAVLPDKPAAAAGIEVGDRVVGVGDVTSPRLSELQSYVNDHKNESIALVVEKGQERIFSIKPAIYEDTGRAGFGISIAELGVVKYPWHLAVYYGFIATFSYLKAILVGFGTLIAGLVTGGGVGADVAGPVGVAVMTGQIARMGFIYLLQFMALLSLNLAVLNILPIPALDGGRLLFIIISKIIRRPVTPKIEQTVHAVGFLLLMALVVVITLKDLGNFKEAIFNRLQ